jgi:hypothetical protein
MFLHNWSLHRMDCGIMHPFLGQTRKTPSGITMKAKLYSVLSLALGLCLPAAARAKSYRLDEILDLARKGNPGLAAGEQATAGIEAQLLEAKRNYMPTGELNSLFAQALRGDGAHRDQWRWISQGDKTCRFLYPHRAQAGAAHLHLR